MDDDDGLRGRCTEVCKPKPFLASILNVTAMASAISYMQLASCPIAAVCTASQSLLHPKLLHHNFIPCPLSFLSSFYPLFPKLKESTTARTKEGIINQSSTPNSCINILVLNLAPTKKKLKTPKAIARFARFFPRGLGSPSSIASLAAKSLRWT